jgi:hypothetical protein
MPWGSGSNEASAGSYDSLIFRYTSTAEAKAARRGCREMQLDTHSYQAPGFYLHLGYAPIGELPGWPRDTSRIFFRKALPRSLRPQRRRQNRRFRVSKDLLDWRPTLRLTPLIPPMERYDPEVLVDGEWVGGSVYSRPMPGGTSAPGKLRHRNWTVGAARFASVPSSGSRPRLRSRSLPLCIGTVPVALVD